MPQLLYRIQNNFAIILIIPVCYTCAVKIFIRNKCYVLGIVVHVRDSLVILCFVVVWWCKNFGEMM